MRSLAVVELTDGRRYALPRRVTESGGLTAGIALFPAMLDDLAATQERLAYELAFKRVSRWECSATEIARYLSERGFAGDCITTTVTRLESERALDDMRAAESHVVARGQRGGRGQRLVRKELLQRGISAGIADTAMVELDDDASAYGVALLRARRRIWTDATAFATTMGPFLQRRGFDYETSRRAISAAWQEVERSDDETADRASEPRTEL